MSHPAHPATRRLINARNELNLALAWMNDKGHTLDCGQQDAALDNIRDLEAMVADLEHEADICTACETHRRLPGRTQCDYCLNG